METVKEIKLWPSGDVTPPPSKSFGHRALICAALAASGSLKGESLISNAGKSEDIEATREAISLFGVETECRDGNNFLLRPFGESQSGIMDCGESGSTLRFLLPIAAMLIKGPVTFTGRGRLMERPLKAYADVFAASGVQFSQNNDSATVLGPLRGGHYHLPGDVSSQFISGLLLALPLAEADSRLSLKSKLESAPYVDMTMEVMKKFGVNVQRDADGGFIVPGRQSYRPTSYRLEADYSQAAFFLAAAALGRPVRCLGLNPDSVQGDRAIVNILTKMNAAIKWDGEAVTAKAARLNAVTVDVSEVPDLVPVLSVLASFSAGTTRIVNAARLRLKESDRLSSMALELRKLGADITEDKDSLTINGQPSLAGDALVDAHNDHRVAMALAVASIGCRGPVRLLGQSSVNKSYPAFWQDFEKEVR